MMHISMYKNYTREITEGSDIEHIDIGNDNYKRVIDMYGINFEGRYGTVIVWACREKSTEIVKSLLEIEGIDVNFRGATRLVAITAACRNDNVEIIKLLLKVKDIDVNLQDYKNRTALMRACYIWNIEIVRLLLKVKNINVNLQDDDGQTALIYACRIKNAEIVWLLLRVKDIDINIRDNSGKTALMWTYWSEEIIELLRTFDKPCKMIMPVYRKYARLYHIREEIDVNDISFKKYSSDDEIKIIIDIHGINFQDNDGWTALMWVCYQENVDFARSLLKDKNIDVNLWRYGTTVLTAICSREENDNTIEIVRMLLEKDSTDVNFRGNFGMTALMLASLNSNFKIVEMLLKAKNTDVDITDNYGNTILKWSKGWSMEIFNLYFMKKSSGDVLR